MTQHQLQELLETEPARALLEGAEERGFVIWKRVAGRTITPELARQLLEEGRTKEVISGFKSRAGKPFRARLVLNGEGKVEFDFPARAQTKEAAVAE